MARRKLEIVRDYTKAQSRLAALTSIDPKLDLGNGLTLPGYRQVYQDFRDSLDKYNTVLSTVDDLYNNALSKLDVLKDHNERMLAGIASKYGKNSSQYEQAGGVRKSEHKSTVAKKTV